LGIPDYYQPLMRYVVVEDADGFIDFTRTILDTEERFVICNPDNTGTASNQDPGDRGYGQSARFRYPIGNQW